jgi:hypothetical protein
MITVNSAKGDFNGQLVKQNITYPAILFLEKGEMIRNNYSYF